MTAALELYKDLRQVLQVTARVVQRPGPVIHVTDQFTVRFYVYNAARTELPEIAFLNPRIYVKGTQYATIVGGTQWHVLHDPLLMPGDVTTLDLPLEAQAEITGPEDMELSERIAIVKVEASLDLSRFFRFRIYRAFYEEIEPN